MTVIRDGYMMLLDELSINGKVVGLISVDGIDWGGEKPAYKKLEVAQVRTGPVRKILTKAGTNVFTFKMIQMLAQNCADLAGGAVVGEKWDAPSTPIEIEGPAIIKTGTGDTITIKHVSLGAMVRGKIGGDGELSMDCEMEMIAPSDKSSPFSIGPTVAAVSADAASISFPKEGGTKVVRVSASGAINVSDAAGFTITRDGNYLVVKADANSGSTDKLTNLTLSLVSDATKKTVVEITQAK